MYEKRTILCGDGGRIVQQTVPPFSTTPVVPPVLMEHQFRSRAAVAGPPFVRYNWPQEWIICFPSSAATPTPSWVVSSVVPPTRESIAAPWVLRGFTNGPFRSGKLEQNVHRAVRKCVRELCKPNGVGMERRGIT